MDDMLVKIEEAPLTQAFSTGEGLDEMIAQVRQIVESAEFDMSTVTGRKGPASLAYSIARVQATCETIGKGFVAERKLQIQEIDKRRKYLRDAWIDLKTKARRPLDDWEAKEEARVAKITGWLGKLRELGNLFDPHNNRRPVHELQENLGRLEAVKINEVWEEFTEKAQRFKDSGISDLRRAIETETERLELQRRAAEAEAKAEEERKAREVAEAKQREADAELARKDAEAQKLQLAEEREKEIAIAAAKAERDRIQREQWEKEQEEKRIAHNERVRQEDMAHRARIEQEVMDDIKASVGLHKEFAEDEIFAAIKAGEIRHIRIEYQ